MDNQQETVSEEAKNKLLLYFASSDERRNDTVSEGGEGEEHTIEIILPEGLGPLSGKKATLTVKR